jgi:hypothetical protein
MSGKPSENSISIQGESQKNKRGRQEGTTFPLGYKKRMDPKQPQLTSFLSKKPTVSQSTNVEHTTHNFLTNSAPVRNLYLTKQINNVNS